MFKIRPVLKRIKKKELNQYSNLKLFWRQTEVKLSPPIKTIVHAILQVNLILSAMFQKQ